jgi:hypothetical protein
MIAMATDADGGIIMRNGTDTIASTYDVFTGVVNGGFYANPVLQRESLVADADGPNGAKCTTPVCATVDP